MTERQKMLSGELYHSGDEELVQLRERAWALCEQYNTLPHKDGEARLRILRQLLGRCGTRIVMEKNIRFDYGCNTYVGENFYCNYDCVFLDVAPITFGDNVFIAPQCGFYAAGHPTDAMLRRADLEYGKPITVGSDVWFGGGVKVMPSVTIGSNVVIGGGSVVVHDIPSDCVAAGNPARVVKKLAPICGE